MSVSGVWFIVQTYFQYEKQATNKRRIWGGYNRERYEQVDEDSKGQNGAHYEKVD